MAPESPIPDPGETIWRLYTDAAGDHAVEVHAGDAVVPLTLHVHELGRISEAGDHATVTFDGRFAASGEPFWDGTIPHVSVAGGNLVTGADLGLLGMAEGETQDLLLPPALAYGYDNPEGHRHEQFNGEWLLFTVTLEELA